MEKIIESVIEYTYHNESEEFTYILREHIEPEIYKEFIAKDGDFTIGMIINIIKRHSKYAINPFEFTFKLGENADASVLVDGIKRFTLDETCDWAVVIY